MIQDIEPKHLYNQYRPCESTADSKILVFRGGDALVSRREDGIVLPERALLAGGLQNEIYLFSVDETPYFLAELAPDWPLPEGFMFDNVRAHRTLAPRDSVYAEMTGWHLYNWYRDNRFCGRCGGETQRDGKLRMLACPRCGNQIFPKICPAIIAAVVDGDRILLTKYAGRAYKNYALIAGFTEIGETAEDTVRREVFEETGVHVKNLRYFATQPWGIDADLLLGYFAELDGSPEIHMDAEELALAGWYRRGEIEPPKDHVSLTNTMIQAFLDDEMPL